MSDGANQKPSDATAAEPHVILAPAEAAAIATSNEEIKCVDAAEPALDNVPMSVVDDDNSNCLDDEETNADRLSKTDDECKEFTVNTTVIAGDQVDGKIEHDSKRTDVETNQFTTSGLSCIDLTETKYESIDPSVSHILDFSSDSYTINVKATTDADQIPALNKKRKDFVLHPDPRPLLGCTWCSSACYESLSQIKGSICPGCKYFADQGWKRVFLNGCNKITFTRPDGETMMSVKSFLQESSKILSPKLGGDANEFMIQKSKRSTRQSKRKTTVTKKTLSVKSQAVKIPERSPSIRKRTITERYTDEVKEKSPKTKDESSKLEAKTASIIQTSNDKSHSTDSSHATSHQTMTLRKAYVCAQDPRPILGCEWCGPEKFASHVCDSCKTFVNLGMTRFNNKTAKRCFFYDKNGNQKYNSTKEYLKDTTKYFTDKQGKKISKTKAPPKKGANAKQRLVKSSISQKKVVSTPVEEVSGAIESAPSINKPVQHGKKSVIIKLPTITQLLEQENGLMGVLQADSSEVFHTHFGSNQTIACKILICLGNADLPSCVFEETPFLQKSNPDSKSTHFIGAVRLYVTGSSEIKYGVAIPQFYANCNMFQESFQIKNYIIPQVTKVKGQTLLLRNDLDDEKTAGQLFAFMYRVMYGSIMLTSAILDCNGLST